MQHAQTANNIQLTRRVRIESKQDEVIGWKVCIYDAETGEQINNIYRAEITLDARELNVVKLFYYKQTEDGAKYIDETTHDVAVASLTRQFPHVDVSAYEVTSE
jgi:hypothetical protein